MKYNSSISGNLSLELHNNRSSGGDDSETETLIVWYMITATVVTMLAVLLLSFCMYHKRLHKKKQHHIDYIHANLPLVRPRISPPNINGEEGVNSHVINFYRQESRRSYISYTSVPTDDIYEHEVLFSRDFGERSRKRPQNLIDLEYTELGESASHSIRAVNHEDISSPCSKDWNKVRYSVDKTNIHGDIFSKLVENDDMVHGEEPPEAYKPTFQAFRNRQSIAVDSPNRKLGLALPALRRSHSVQITSHFPHSECKLPHQSDNFKLLSLPKPAFYTDRSMKGRQNETML